MSDAPKLLPCPFCGGSELTEDRLGRIQCETCGATAPYGYKVYEGWNTRTDLAQAELQAAVEAEREACAIEVSPNPELPDVVVSAKTMREACADEIRDRGNTDALEAAKAEVRAEALREAAEAVEKMENYGSAGIAVGLLKAEQTILALIPTNGEDG